MTPCPADRLESIEVYVAFYERLPPGEEQLADNDEEEGLSVHFSQSVSMDDSATTDERDETRKRPADRTAGAPRKRIRTASSDVDDDTGGDQVDGHEEDRT